MYPVHKDVILRVQSTKKIQYSTNIITELKATKKKNFNKKMRPFKTSKINQILKKWPPIVK
jgi:hypothetical protein